MEATQVAITPDVRVPAIGIGTWYLGDQDHTRAREIAALRAGLEAGARLVDTAEMYGNGRSERLVGEALKGIRDQAFLVSKVLPTNATRRGTVAACEASLRRLGTDHLDLYLLHWSGLHPVAGTIAAFEQLRAEGKIAAWGVSNMDPGEMEAIWGTPGGPDCATDQVLYNLTRRGPELDLFPLLAEHRTSVMAYSPLEQGRLFAGAAGRALTSIAADAGTTPTALALAWAIRDGRTVAIPKSGDPQRMLANLAALDVTLSAETLARLDEAFPAPRRPVPLEML
ncbi:aldo/keto reductase [Raineyella fluvialis]|uniref:Aldo/keto reductase n=1 Tax=Raineyella fluvialis TaxID=2662261 RepID=A0A5Q2FE58_9ACTN|nr:aldo/keto reductase [Raineyella fluvialis]QGF23373.1 aldo/keto reductase [Raineyella fluvialis]